MELENNTQPKLEDSRDQNVGKTMLENELKMETGNEEKNTEIKLGQHLNLRLNTLTGWSGEDV